MALKVGASDVQEGVPLVTSQPELETPSSDKPITTSQETSSLVAHFLVPYLNRFGLGSFAHRIEEVLHGSLWTLVGYGGGQLLRAATTIILARMLLGPREFGLVALVTVFLSGLDLLTDLGIGMDVVQHPRGDEPPFINTAFLIQVLRGLVIGGVAIAMAYPFAHFYNQPQATWLVVVCAFSVVIRGFASGSIWTLTRHIEIKRLTFINLAGDTAGFLIALIWALLSPTAWALVVGRVASSIIYVAASHFVSKLGVSLQWDKSAAKDIMAFGTGIFVSSATYFLGGEAERLFLAKFATVSELGCYSLAITLAMLPTRAVSQIVGQVFFPMLSQSIRKNRDVAAVNYVKARWIFFALGAGLALFFIGGSTRLVAVVLGPKYYMTGWMLQLIGVRAAFELFSAPCGNLLLACGVARYFAMSNALRALLVSIGMWMVNARFGIHGIIVLLLMVPIVAHPFVLWGVFITFRKALRAEVLSYAAFLVLVVLALLLAWHR
jgi:O-antigen/teichoic acid export membrane protein